MLSRQGTKRPTGIDEAPVELRFIDLLLLIIAMLMFVTVLLTIVSAFLGSGRPDVAPRILTAVAPAALTGRYYELTLAATGGDGSYTWQIAAGQLPDGLSLLPQGVIRGVPHVPGSTTATIQVTDGQKRSYQRELAFAAQPSGMSVAPRAPVLRVLTPRMAAPDAVDGRSYHYSLAANAGTPPYRWAIRSGQTPGGLDLTPDGDIIGVPTKPGSSTFAVAVIDATGATAVQQVSLIVLPAPRPWWDTVFFWLWWVINIVGYLLILAVVWALLWGAEASSGFDGPLKKLMRRWRTS